MQEEKVTWTIRIKLQRDESHSSMDTELPSSGQGVLRVPFASPPPPSAPPKHYSFSFSITSSDFDFLGGDPVFPRIDRFL